MPAPAPMAVHALSPQVTEVFLDAPVTGQSERRGLYAVFADEANRRFLGLVTPRDLAREGAGSFVAARVRTDRVTADTPLDAALARLDRDDLEALAVMTADGRFIGAMDRASALQALLRQEQELRAQIERLQNAARGDAQPLSAWAGKLEALLDVSQRLLADVARQPLTEDQLQHSIETLVALLGADYAALDVVDAQGRARHSVVDGGHSPDEPPLLAGALAVPLVCHGQTFGRLCFDNKRDGVAFTSEDAQLATMFARTLALALSHEQASRAREDAYATLKEAAEALSAEIGESVFQSLVQHVTRALGVDFAVLGEICPDSDTVRTVAVCVRGEIQPNFSYSLHGSPCHEALGHCSCFHAADGQPEPQHQERAKKHCSCIYPAGVRARFPEDRLLAEMGVESYMGIPLADSTGQPLGLLAVMHSQPMRTHGASEAVLQIFATRAAAEMERKRAEVALRESEERFRATFDQAAAGIAHVDLDGRWLRVNRKLCDILGYGEHELMGLDAFEHLTHPEDRETGRDAGQRLIAGEIDSCLVEKRYLRKNGAVIWAEISISLVRDTQGKPQYFVGIVEDVTTRRQTEKALRESEAGLALAQRVAHIGNWDWNIQGKRLWWSEEVYRLFGLDAEKHDLTYEMFLQIIHPDDRELVKHALMRTLVEGAPYNIDHRIVLPDGSERVVHEQAEVTLGDDGKPVRIFGTVQDVTERAQAQQHLSYLAHYDGLTGLPNRVLLNDRLRQAMIEADRHERLVAVFFLDLDRFKTINDTLGHEAGDALLKSVAQRLRDTIRRGDTLARLGGDEFTLVLADMVNVQDAATMAQKVLNSFAAPFLIDNRELFVSTSIGITIYPFDDNSIEGLLKSADTAMYHAKERGRNAYQFYSAEMNAQAFKRLTLHNALSRALEREELELHYQPQIDLRSGRITGVEALLRWQHPDLGVIPPQDFIPLAEETGLIVPIGEWVLRTACLQSRAWQEAGGPNLRMAINLSTRQLQQPRFARMITDILQETRVSAETVELELTETLLMQNVDTALPMLRRIYDTGIGLAIDDFGVGFSSLSYLRQLPIDAVKIDRSFVHDLAGDPANMALVTAIIAMAHSLKLRVIAEAVETPEQLAFLRAQGCDQMQGFLLLPPLSGAELEARLALGPLTLPA